jgi:hypothetical protein
MNWLDIVRWILFALIFVIVCDFIRLAIMREIWKRRHARMVEEIRQRAAEMQIHHGIDHK